MKFFKIWVLRVVAAATPTCSAILNERSSFTYDISPLSVLIRKTQEGCGGLRGESPGALAKVGPIFQRSFSLLENAQTLVGIAFRAAGKSGRNFPAASKFARKTVPARNFGQPQPSRVVCTQ